MNMKKSCRSEFHSILKHLFWVWLLLLILFNVIPLGNETNASLSRNKLAFFRLDYLVHSITFLVFACIWLLGKMNGVRWFERYEALKYSSIVFGAALLFECLQLLTPWRTFNWVDMVYNVFGAVVSAGIICL